MAKDPAFLFYSDNFQSGTQFFSDEQTGKYIRLLCAQHLHGHLPEKHMMHICKSHDVEIWAKFKKDSAGLYFNERLEDEISKRKKYSESRSKNRKSTDSTKEHMKKTSKSYVNHMGDGNGIGNEDDNVIKIENFLCVEMQKVFLKHIPKYKKNGQRDFPALLSIAKFLAEHGQLTGSVTENQKKILEAWEPLCIVASKDKFYSTKPLSTISNQIQELLNFALNGKPDGKIKYGSPERADGLDKLFAERYKNG